eukprot:558149-Alexandrium_andersonii.AAC.1
MTSLAEFRAVGTDMDGAETVGTALRDFMNGVQDNSSTGSSSDVEEVAQQQPERDREWIGNLMDQVFRGGRAEGCAPTIPPAPEGQGEPGDPLLSLDSVLSSCSGKREPNGGPFGALHMSHATKRGLRSLSACCRRKQSRRDLRAESRRWRRWVASNMARDHEVKGRGTLNHHFGEGHQPPIPMRGKARDGGTIGAERGTQVSTLRYGTRLRVATVNVRSLMKPTMQHQVTTYMDQHDIHVMLLQETRIPTTTQFRTAGYHFVLFGGGGK